MLTITRGDTAVLTLTAQSGDGVDFDISGATFTTYIRGPGTTVVEIPHAQHTPAPDQATNPGNFTVSLTETNTFGMSVSEGKEIITKIVQGSSTIYFHGRTLLTVLSVSPVA